VSKGSVSSVTNVRIMKLQRNRCTRTRLHDALSFLSYRTRRTFVPDYDRNNAAGLPRSANEQTSPLTLHDAISVSCAKQTHRATTAEIRLRSRGSPPRFVYSARGCMRGFLIDFAARMHRTFADSFKFFLEETLASERRIVNKTVEGNPIITFPCLPLAGRLHVLFISAQEREHSSSRVITQLY